MVVCKVTVPTMGCGGWVLYWVVTERGRQGKRKASHVVYGNCLAWMDEMHISLHFKVSIKCPQSAMNVCVCVIVCQEVRCMHSIVVQCSHSPSLTFTAGQFDMEGKHCHHSSQLAHCIYNLYSCSQFHSEAPTFGYSL